MLNSAEIFYALGRRLSFCTAKTPTRTLAGAKSRSAAVSRLIEVCYPSGRKHWRHGVVKRREFIALLGGSAAAWPIAARAQSPMPLIGFLHAGSPSERVHLVGAMREGLRASGYIEGQNITIDYRWAEDQFDRLPELAAELVRRQASVIVTPAGTVAALAAKRATPTIPIVFGSENDPVKAELVASFNRPGGNATGVYFLSGGLTEKRLGLIRELLPRADLIGILLNPNDPLTDAITSEVRQAASVVGQRIEVLHAKNSREIDAAFASLMRERASAVVVGPGPLFFTRRVQIVTLATRHVIPAIYGAREFTQVGGLMSYGTDLADVYRQVGDYAGRILKGAKPADLPVMQTTKLELVINLQTARTFDLEIPPTLLARADEVFE
jgi:putative ABC transport system substrate-binding protein